MNDSMLDKIKNLTDYGKRNVRGLNTEVGHLRDDQKNMLEFALNRDWSVPKFKFRHFVGDAQITPFGKLKQFLVELKSREEALEELEYQIAKHNINIKIEQKRVEQSDDELEKELHKLELFKLEKDSKKLARRLDDAYKERQKFFDLLDEFNNSPEGKLSDGRYLIEVFGDDDAEEALESQYWTVRLAKQAAMDIVAYGRIGGGNMDSIAMLPQEQQAQILYSATDYSLRLENTTNVLRNESMKQLQLGTNGSDINKILQLPTGTEIGRE